MNEKSSISIKMVIISCCYISSIITLPMIILLLPLDEISFWDMKQELYLILSIFSFLYIIGTLYYISKRNLLKKINKINVLKKPLQEQRKGISPIVSIILMGLITAFLSFMGGNFSLLYILLLFYALLFVIMYILKITHKSSENNSYSEAHKISSFNFYAVFSIWYFFTLILLVSIFDVLIQKYITGFSFDNYFSISILIFVIPLTILVYILYEVLKEMEIEEAIQITNIYR